MRHLAIKSFFLSLIFHFIVLNFFIFTFDVKQASLKPSFTFLGSILNYHDIATISKNINQKSGEISITPFKDDLLKKSRSRFEKQFLNKPIALRAGKGRSKETLKSIFEIEENKMGPKNILSTIEYHFDTASFNPLTL